MGVIVDIGDAKGDTEKVENLSGEWLCMNCQHTYIGVAPVGVTECECPECHTMKAVPKFPVSRGEFEWHCDCSNTLFRITPDGIYCPNCGLSQEGF